VLRAKRAVLDDPPSVSNAAAILKAQEELDAAQAVVDELYGRWAELEAKIG
jgi:hypothetical protein